MRRLLLASLILALSCNNQDSVPVYSAILSSEIKPNKDFEISLISDISLSRLCEFKIYCWQIGDNQYDCIGERICD